MPHAVTYHADGNVLLLGDGSPGVTGAVHRYFHLHADAPGKLLQCLVHPTLAVVILFPDIGDYILVNNAQQMLAVEGRVAVCNLLHTGAPCYSQFFTRFLSPVYKLPVLDASLFKKGDIYERHASGIETEEEEISRQRFLLGDGCCSDYLMDVFRCKCSFGSRGVLGERVGEGFAVFQPILLQGFVVDSSETLHVKRDGVQRKTVLSQITLVIFHDEAVELANLQVFLFSESHEAAQGARIYFGRPVLAILVESLGEFPDIFAQHRTNIRIFFGYLQRIMFATFLYDISQCIVSVAYFDDDFCILPNKFLWNFYS